MEIDCCNHLLSLRHKPKIGYFYYCSRCGLESPKADSADNAKNLWEKVSSECTKINSDHQLWKYHIEK